MARPPDDSLERPWTDGSWDLRLGAADRIAGLLADPTLPGDRVLARLRDLGHAEAVPACALAASRVLSLDLSEAEAEAFLTEVLRHRATLRERLGRDLGFVGASMDYLCNVRPGRCNVGVVDDPPAGSVAPGIDRRTGVLDRRAVHRELEREARRSLRHGCRAALLLADLDRFGALNARFGAEFGDAVIERAGRAVRRAVRESDVVGRYGGDEFLVILPRSDRGQASTAAERLRRSLAADFQEFPVAGEVVSLTVSVGIACFPEDGNSRAAWVAAAGRSLGRAKDGGRARVVAHPTERRSSIRLPMSRSVSTRVTWDDGRSVDARTVEIGSDGVVIEGLDQATQHDLVRLRIDGHPVPCHVRGRVLRWDPCGGRAVIVLAERNALESLAGRTGIHTVRITARGSAP